MKVKSLVWELKTMCRKEVTNNVHHITLICVVFLCNLEGFTQCFAEIKTQNSTVDS